MPDDGLTQRPSLLDRLFGLFKGQEHPREQDDEALDVEQGRMQDWFNKQFVFPQGASGRIERYRIFDEMDTFDIVQTIHDIYAEESTQTDYDKRRTLWVESSNANMVRAGHECLTNVQAEDRIFGVARALSVRGDEFKRLIYQTGRGVLGWKSTHPSRVHRRDDKYDRLIGFSEDGQIFRGSRKHSVSWPWDYIHFRLTGKDDSGYGTAISANMFRAWRQVALSEDAILMYRLRRTPERNVFWINTGDMEEAERVDTVNRWRKRFRANVFVDPASASYKKSYNPLTPLEDIFLPVNGSDDGSRVESLAGGGQVGELLDLDYFRQKLFGAARVPAAYAGFPGEINAKATLVQQDVRFARGLKRFQRAQVQGMRTLLEIHYSLLAGSNPELDPDVNNFLLQMSPISYLDEWERLELLQMRYSIIDAMNNMVQALSLDVRAWSTYILLNYAKLPENLVLRLVSKAAAPTTAAPGESYLDQRKQMLVEKQRALNEHARAKYGTDLTGGGEGIYTLSESEQQAIADMIHRTPMLRKLVSNLTEVSLEEAEVQQCDPSVRPPRYYASGSLLEHTDSVEDDRERAKLDEDLKSLEQARESHD